MTIPAIIRQTFTKCKVLGSGEGRMSLSGSELSLLLQIACSDLHLEHHLDRVSLVQLPQPAYYDIQISFFSKATNANVSANTVLSKLHEIVQEHQDFLLYFRNICSLHQRRKKYQRILSEQPRPTVEQVGPRALLEYGICDIELLKSWMLWRKWIFDIDNRSGQETGYLFEPILASCIGGEPIGSRNSPVSRLNADGIPVSGGRQIDCLVAEENTVYEFKLRVSVAASGQGRFSEELSFPREARAAGFTPVLLVLDPTPSNRLEELSRVFESVDGLVFLGEDAWKHIDEKAGSIMAKFVEKYIRPPLDAIDDIRDNALMKLELSWSDTHISISSDSENYRINRR